MQILANPQTTAPQNCWFNGSLVPLERARVSVFDHGLLYGDGVFEGLRFYYGRAFRVERHLARLARSLKALQIVLPYDEQAMLEAIQHTIDASGLEDGYLRLVVTRGEGSLGLNPKHCLSPSVFILAAELELASPEKREKGLKLITASTKRMTGSGLDSRIKSLNYMHSILAKMEANNAGADDALLLNQEGRVAECSAANIFIVNGNTLVTPPVLDGALEGITREAVLEVAESCGLEAQIRSLSVLDIYTADECFVTGSGARITPVHSLDGREISSVAGDRYRAISSAYSALIERELR